MHDGGFNAMGLSLSDSPSKSYKTLALAHARSMSPLGNKVVFLTSESVRLSS